MIPGYLQLARGELRFRAETYGSASRRQLRKLSAATDVDLVATLESGRWATVFARPVAELRFIWPWYYFSAGLKVAAPDLTWRVGFAPPARSNGNKDLGLALEDLDSLFAARRTGRAWRRLLVPAPRALRPQPHRQLGP